jgi:hypothetical protein
MGDFMDKEEGTFTAGMLNDMFGPQNIKTTNDTAEHGDSRDAVKRLIRARCNTCVEYLGFSYYSQFS